MRRTLRPRIDRLTESRCSITHQPYPGALIVPGGQPLLTVPQSLRHRHRLITHAAHLVGLVLIALIPTPARDENQAQRYKKEKSTSLHFNMKMTRFFDSCQKKIYFFTC